VWNIKLNNGQELKCNGEHKWLINGEMTSTKDIKIGDKLFKPNGGIVQACDYMVDFFKKDFNLGEVVGYVVGDGWVGKESGSHNKMIGIVYDEDCRHYSDSFRILYSEITDDVLTYERSRGKIFEVRTENKEFVSFFEAFGIKESKYVVPSRCYTDLTFCAGFLRGLYQADGCVRWNGKKGKIILTSVSTDIVGGVRDLLQNWFGIHSTLKSSESKGVEYGGGKISNFKQRYDLVISTREHLLRFKEYIGLLGRKGSILNEIHGDCQQYNNRISLKVESVIATDKLEDMYCAEVKGLHSFVVSGCMSSNCSEQYLSRESLCVLASINCGKFSAKQEIFMGQLEKVGHSVNRFLDNVNECELVNQTFATPHQELAIRKLRRTGAGVTNIAAWLFKRGLPYGSKEGNDAIEEFIKWYNYWLYVSTEELGLEKGDFGLFNKDKWRTAPFVARVIKESEKMHEEFKVPILKGTHARNVTVSSIAPTGTLSLMFRDFVLSYGIEPAFFMYFWKRTRMTGKYEYYFCVPRVIRDAFAEAGIPIPMASDTVKDTWDGKIGAPIAKFIEEHRHKFKFKESTDVTAMDKLELMSKVMKWIDSSISVTYMLPIGSTWKEVYNFIMEAHKREVKSIAAFPDKKMYGIVSNMPFKTLAFKLKDENVVIGHQNFSDDELRELNLSRENIRTKTTESPKRLPSIDADIHVVSVKGEKFVIVVGIQNNQPYEIFGGHINGFSFKFAQKKGKITKVKKGQYALEIDDISIDDFSKQFTPTEQILFRMASMAMRHGVPIQFVVEQLQKAQNDITSMAAAAARCLKKYIVDGTGINGRKCPSCGKELVYIDGCCSCPNCGWSQCG
jgi:ribonucleotide reductase alpha subunit